MKVLVIGGSYFLGRVLTMMSYKDFDLTLINRGQYSMKHYNVKEYQFDRHDAQAWSQMPLEDYDAIVDFCAYQSGDIQTVIQSFKGQIKQYILISTVDVYQRQTGLLKDENHELERRHFPGDAGEYIFQKVLLEKELKELCTEYKIPYTILRPGNIYGPFNYAPRESEFIKRIVYGLPLYDISDADASFQLVFVKDVARAIMLCIEKKAYQKIYNVISPDIIHYLDIYQSLKKCCDHSILIKKQSFHQLQQMNYPLPYPIFKQEEELYNGQLISKELGLQYTSLDEGMKKTYQAFLPVYQK